MSTTNHSGVLPPLGHKVRLIGGPFDGCIGEFTGGRGTILHDPDRLLPGDRAGADAMYLFDLDLFKEIGKIHIETATWVEDADPADLKRP